MRSKRFRQSLDTRIIVSLYRTRKKGKIDYERSRKTRPLRAVTKTAVMYDNEIANERRWIWLLYSPRTCFMYFSLLNELLTDSNNAWRHRKFSLHAHSTSVYKHKHQKSVISMLQPFSYEIRYICKASRKNQQETNYLFNWISNIIVIALLKQSMQDREKWNKEKDDFFKPVCHFVRKTC